MPQAFFRSPTLRFFFLLNLVLLLALPVAAQSPDAILKKAAKAMGGEKALRSVKARQLKGVVTRITDSATGTYQMSTGRPNLLTTSFDVAGFEVSAGYNGKSGWSRDSREGLRTLTGPSSRDFQAEAVYRNSLWLDYKRAKSKVALGPTVTLDGRAANTVILTTLHNVRIKMFFDTASGLLIRDEIPLGESTRVFEYSEHRSINGVMEPHSIVVTIASERYQIKVEEVAHKAVIAAAAFDFPKVSNEPLPDILALVKEVGENEDVVDRMLENYTFTEFISTRSFDKSGKSTEKESETFERTHYKGNRIRRLIAKNGQPLNAEQQAQEDKRIEKRIREIEKRESEKEKKAQSAVEAGDTSAEEEGSRRVSLADLLRASKLVNPRRERFRNRDVVVFDFEPLPGYKPRKAQEKLFGKMAGVLWIDTADKQVARVEARLVESYKIGGGLLASLKEGGNIVMEQDRINNEIWLPTRTDLTLSIRVLVVKNIDAFRTVDYGNYKRFNVDAEKEKLIAPATVEKKP